MERPGTRTQHVSNSTPMKNLYFAYGSNLSATAWRRYCEERGVSPQGLVFSRAAWLPDWEVSFQFRSRSRRGGALTIHPRMGTAVPGALFEVDEDTWSLLDKKEGLATGVYARVEIIVLDEQGREWACTTYEVTKASRTEAPIEPAEGYHETVRTALKELDLPTQQLDAAARGEEPPLLPSGLFTYGTLMQGESRWTVASGIASGEAVDATSPGVLLDLSGYPGLINGNDPNEVAGEFLPLCAAKPWSESIDAIEDFLGYGHPESLYRRIIRRINGPEDQTHAWTYLYIGPSSGVARVGGNDWRKRPV